MKKVFLLILSTTIFCCAQQKNKLLEDDDQFKIDSVFNHYVHVLDFYLVDPTTDSSGSRIQMMHYLENLTGIMSSGPITYLGRYHYVKGDIKNWREWYSENRKYLYWDVQKKQIIYKKK